jgi:hypothetical protein
MEEIGKQDSDWSSLEIAKLAVGSTTPVVVGILGWIINRRLKNIDQIQWQNRKIIEKRLDLYDKIAPHMNRIFCFIRWVGYWKDITPDQMLESKRELDRIINIYKYLIGDDFYHSYESFISFTFETWIAPGSDPKVRSVIEGANGNRRKDCNYTWEQKWESYFTNEISSFEELENKYERAMNQLKKSIGLI